MTPRIEQVLARASTLKPFPRAAQRALTLLDDPLVSAGKLSEVISLDAALTSGVLKAANSAALARSRSVDNLQQALALLGNQAFKQIVFASASVGFLADGQPGYQLSPGDLWHHAVATSLMVEVLAAAAKVKPGPALFTAALLHDLGKSVLGDFVKDDLAVIDARVRGGESYLEAERAVLGIDHAELGARIVERWNFSAELADLIRFHHAPQQKPQSTDLALLSLANVVCQLYGLGAGADSLLQRADGSTLAKLGLKLRDLEGAMAELHVRLSKAQALLGMA